MKEWRKTRCSKGMKVESFFSSVASLFPTGISNTPSWGGLVGRIGRSSLLYMFARSLQNNDIFRFWTPRMPASNRPSNDRLMPFTRLPEYEFPTPDIGTGDFGAPRTNSRSTTNPRQVGSTSFPCIQKQAKTYGESRARPGRCRPRFGTHNTRGWVS